MITSVGIVVGCLSQEGVSREAVVAFLLGATGRSRLLFQARLIPTPAEPPITRHSTLFYLTTLPARYSKACGMVTPICFAVFRFITSSNFFGCSIGRSAGLAPFKILSM